MLLPLFGGCSTPHGTDGATAWTDFTGHSLTEMRQAIREAFEAEGYEVRPASGADMVLEKSGRNVDDVLFGGWSKGVTSIRALVDLMPMGGGLYRVTVKGYTVRNAGDPVLEDKQKMSRAHRKRFEPILEKARAQLAGTPSA